MMDKNNESTSPGNRNLGNRQVGGLVPAPDGSEAQPKSDEGPIRELPASSQMDVAIAEDYCSIEEESEFVVAWRPGQKKRSPRGGNPRVVAVTKLDKEIRIVPGPRLLIWIRHNLPNLPQSCVRTLRMSWRAKEPHWWRRNQGNQSNRLKWLRSL